MHLDCFRICEEPFPDYSEVGICEKVEHMRKTKKNILPTPFTRVSERFKSCGIALAFYPGSQISKAIPQAKQLPANKPRNTGEPHLFRPSNYEKVRFFPTLYYSQNYAKETEIKAIQISLMPVSD